MTEMKLRSVERHVGSIARVPERRCDVGVRPSALADPVFLLAPPLSFSAVCAMLGQHPQMYGLPELHLFVAETLAEWWSLAAHTTFDMADGLLRVVAQLYFDGQTEHDINLARGWLWRRAHVTTGYVFELLAEKVHPLIVLEKSPSIVFRVELMRRAYRMFPFARFIHLVQHPKGYSE